MKKYKCIGMLMMFLVGGYLHTNYYNDGIESAKAKERDIIDGGRYAENIEKIVNEFNIYTDENDDESTKKIKCFNEVFKAIEQGEWAKVGKVKNFLTGVKNDSGDSLFMACVKAKKAELVIKIIKKNIFENLLCGDCINEIFPMHVAVKNNDKEMVQVLLGNGLSHIDPQNELGQSPLHIAIEFARVELMEDLIESGASTKIACPIVLNENNETVFLSPIPYSIMHGTIECFDILRRNNEEIDCQIEKIGNIIHLAIYFNQVEMLDHILTNLPVEKLQCLLEAYNANDQTPLILAAMLRRAEMIKLLYNKGAKLDARDSYGNNALHFAAKNHDKDIIKLLYCLGIERVENIKRESPRNFIENDKSLSATITVNLLKSLYKQEQQWQKSNHDFFYKPPLTIFLQGNETTAQPFLGVMHILKEKNMLNSVARIASHSGGAIIALLFALGYDIENIPSFMKEIDRLFTKIDDDKINNFANFIKNLSENLENKSNLMLKQHFTNMCNCEIDISDINQNLREWLEEKIYAKTNITNCTFGELRRLIEANANLKHFHVFVSDVEKDVIYSINSEETDWSNHIISDTLIASFSVPVLFPPFLHLQCKDSFKNKYDCGLGCFIDATLFGKFPLSDFDKKKYLKKTFFMDESSDKEGAKADLNKVILGIKLNYDLSIDLKNDDNIISGLELIDLYYKIISQQAITYLKTYDQYRIIEIENDQQENLMESGSNAAIKFFENKENALVSCIEQIN